MFSIIADCASGSEYNFNTNVCDTCPRGYYRDKNDRLQYECQICDLNFITASAGATSSAACNVSKCCTIFTVSRLVGQPTMWLLNRSDTNQAILSQKIARDWKFWNKKVEKLYYLCRENKGTDQISFAVTALICAFVFAYADCWFFHEAAHCDKAKYMYTSLSS